MASAESAATELTWLLLGAIGPTQPVGIIFDTVNAWTGDAGSTSLPLDSAGTRIVASTQPAASVATSAAASLQRARGKIQADISHLSIADSLLGAAQPAAVAGPVPAVVASPSRARYRPCPRVGA